MSKQMIGVDVGGYAFDKDAGTVSITGLNNNLTLEQVLLITNVTSQDIIYQFNNANKGASIASNVLTLEYDTSGMANTDSLQIFVQLGDSEFRQQFTLFDINGNPALITASGQLNVINPPPAPPAGTDPVSVIERNLVDTTEGVDNEYTITNGKTLTIQRLSGGSEISNSGSIIELFEDPNGDKSVLNLIEDVYVRGQKDLNESYIGNGVRRIVMRRRNFGGGIYQVTGRWEGFEE